MIAPPPLKFLNGAISKVGRVVGRARRRQLPAVMLLDEVASLLESPLPEPARFWTWDRKCFSSRHGNKLNPWFMNVN